MESDSVPHPSTQESQPQTQPSPAQKQYKNRGGHKKHYNYNNFHGRGNFKSKRGGGYQNTFQNLPNYPNQNQNYFNPYYQQQMLYRSEMYIFTKYHKLIDINTTNAGVVDTLTNASQFFVIKSFSAEDIHKAIKYGLWSSSKTGNLTLSSAFNLCKEKGGFVYLFFSPNGSGKYVGVARMKTPCDDTKTFDYWTQDGKWPGLFEVEWIFIKDVPFKEFKDIIITMRDGETKPISNARDTQEIPFEQAKIMMDKICKYENCTTILEHFEFYDMRQDNYEKNTKMKKMQFQQMQAGMVQGFGGPNVPNYNMNAGNQK